MGAYYSTDYIMDYLKKFLNNSLSPKDLQSFLEDVVAQEELNNLNNNLILLIFIDFFQTVKSNYSSWINYLFISLKMKIISSSLNTIVPIELKEEIQTQKEENIAEKNSSTFSFKDVSAQINSMTDEEEEALKIFQKRYKKISKSEFPDVKLPPPGSGSDILNLKDNITIPGSVYTMELELDSEGNVLNILNLIKQKDANSANDIFQGILGDLIGE